MPQGQFIALHTLRSARIRILWPHKRLIATIFLRKFVDFIDEICQCTIAHIESYRIVIDRVGQCSGYNILEAVDKLGCHFQMGEILIKPHLGNLLSLVGLNRIDTQSSWIFIRRHPSKHSTIDTERQRVVEYSLLRCSLASRTLLATTLLFATALLFTRTFLLATTLLTLSSLSRHR